MARRGHVDKSQEERDEDAAARRKKAIDAGTGKGGGSKPMFGTKEWAKERGVFKEGDK
jgi:hypothetical protein